MLEWIAVVISLIAIIWQIKNATDRRTWESEQSNQQKSDAKDLQDRQNKWQTEQENERRTWEAEQNRLRLEKEEEWRKEEITRLERWRHEDNIVASSPNLPRMEVTIELTQGERAQPGDPRWILVTGVNVGTVPITLKHWGQLLLSNDTPFEHEQLQVCVKSYGLATGNIDKTQRPGDVFGYEIPFEKLKDSVYGSELSLPVEFRGYFVDQTDRIHTSDPFFFEREFLTHAMPD